MRILRRRPSPATAIALVALFVALTGTAYAAATITGRDVVDRSLTYHDIARSTIGPGEAHNLRGFNLQKATVGGYQVDESTLGTVPTAANSYRVNGLTPQKFSARIAPNGAEQKVVDFAGEELLATCPAGKISLRLLGFDRADESSEVAVSVVSNSNQPFGYHNADFNPGQEVDLNQGAQNGSGTLSFARTDGKVVTATFGFGSGTAFGIGAGCAVYGTSLNG